MNQCWPGGRVAIWVKVAEAGARSDSLLPAHAPPIPESIVALCGSGGRWNRFSLGVRFPDPKSTFVPGTGRLALAPFSFVVSGASWQRALLRARVRGTVVVGGVFGRRLRIFAGDARPLFHVGPVYDHLVPQVSRVGGGAVVGGGSRAPSGICII